MTQLRYGLHNGTDPLGRFDDLPNERRVFREHEEREEPPPERKFPATCVLSNRQKAEHPVRIILPSHVGPHEFKHLAAMLSNPKVEPVPNCIQVRVVRA